MSRHLVSPRARRAAAAAPPGPVARPEPVAPPEPVAAPALTSVVEVDVTGLGEPLLAHVARAVVSAAPGLGAGPHLGIAVDTDRGRVVPVIRDAGDLSVAGLGRRIAELTHRARAGTATGSGEAAITLAGDRGVLWETPVLVPGQVAILGCGAPVQRPAVVRLAGGEPAIAVRSLVYLALTYDGRRVDGVDAARFLAAVKERLGG